MTIDRNTQINFQGDPARELEFIQSQNQRTGEAAKAVMPQLATLQWSEDFERQIRAADILDPEQGVGYEAPDAPPGAEQGRNVNAEFEKARGGLSEGYENTGEAGSGETPLFSGYFEDNDPKKGPQRVTLKPELAEQAEGVEVADPQGGDLHKNAGKKK